MVYQPKKKYEWWSQGTWAVDANVVGAVCEQLEEQNGQVTKEEFLEVSRPEDAPTHALFEWNDSIAAEKWRLDQSRRIINGLRIVYENKDKEEVKVSAFIQTSPTGTNTVYENIHEALRDVGKREIVLNRIRGELDAFINRNRNIEELADILEEAAERLRKRGKK